ncbi:MAG: CsgG/HfaB family protein [Lentisphaeria bacterium]|nr:CsgG/HfaB family protein [Lentisphaeria bacterium]
MAPLRLALVELGGETPVPAPLTDLLFIELNASKELHLLERQEVTRVLAEQKLGLMIRGAVDADSAIQAGKILAADAILILENENHSEKPLLRTRLVDTRYGLKLFDGSLALPKTADGYEALAGQVAARAARHIRRINVPPDQLLLVGVSSFFSYDLSNKWDWLSDEIPRVIEQNLSLYPGVALLERKATAPLSDERDIASAIPKALQASAVILSGRFRLSDNGQSVEVDVKARKGNAVVEEVTFEIPVDEMTGGCIKATQALLEKLRGAGTGHPMDAEEEAKVLAAEARAYINRAEGSRAMPAAEAALALVPESLDYMELAINSMLGSGGVLDNGQRNVEDPRLLLPFHRRAGHLARKIILTCPLPPLAAPGIAWTDEDNRHNGLHIYALEWARNALSPLYYARKDPRYCAGGSVDVLYEELWDVFHAAQLRYAERPRLLVHLVTQVSDQGHGILRAGSIEEAMRRTDELLELEVQALSRWFQGRDQSYLHSLSDYYLALYKFWKENKDAGNKGLAYLLQLQNHRDAFVRAEAVKYALRFYKEVVPDQRKRRELAAAYVKASKAAGRPDPSPVMRVQYDPDEAENERIEMGFIQDLINYSLEHGLAKANANGWLTGTLKLTRYLERQGKPAEALDYLERLAVAFEKRKYGRWQNVVNEIDRLKKRHPQLQKASAQDLLPEAIPLLRTDDVSITNDEEETQFCRFASVDNDWVIIASLRRKRSYFGVVRFDPSTRRVDSTIQAVNLCHPGWQKPNRVLSWIPRVALFDGGVHLGCEATGIVTLRDDGTISRRHADNGLPLNGIGGVASLGDWLFCIAGGDYTGLQALISVNVKTDKVSVICSSREIRSSDKARLVVPGMATDPQRKLLWFIRRGIGTKTIRPDYSPELYRYDPATERMEAVSSAQESIKLVGCGGRSGRAGSLMRMSGDTLIISGTRGIFEFNVETEQSQMLRVAPKGKGGDWEDPWVFFDGHSFFRVTDGLVCVSEKKLMHFQKGRKEAKTFPVTAFAPPPRKGSDREKAGSQPSPHAVSSYVIDLLATKEGLYVLTRDALWLVPEIKAAGNSSQGEERL